MKVYMKVKFGILKGLDGNDVKNGSEYVYNDKTIAQIIATDAAKDNVLQRYELATKLYNANGNEVEITESEKEIIKQTINSGTLSILLAAQALSAMNNAYN